MFSKIIWPDGLSDQAFLDEYWQQKPLLIKQGLPDFETPISPDELAGLAIEEDTTPRLILQDSDGEYSVENGPFEEERFATLQNNDWSLLVTDVEKHLPEISEYLTPFQFLPSWRIDDLMISYAPEGASVGAHVDEYDVFLLQASGTRRWMIDDSDSPDVSLVERATLKLLATFNASQTFDLSPGDILYLPPGVPHHGVAIGDDCTTWSVGFRAPALADIVNEFSELLASELPPSRYTDPKLQVATPGEISGESIARFGQLWRDATQLTDEQLASLVGRLVSTPSIDIERESISGNRILELDWIKHPFSRFAFITTTKTTHLFVDSEIYQCSNEFAKQLCAGEIVSGPSLNEQDKSVLTQLLAAGAMQAADG